jgi:hypothetical protein
MKFLPHFAVSTVVLWVAVSASPATAAGNEDGGHASTGAAAAAAGWGMAYEADPATGHYVLMGFADPAGGIVPFDEGQQGFVADVHTGELAPLIPGRSAPEPLAAPHKPSYSLSE